MKSYLSEFLGTFLFVFAFTCAFVWSGGSILWTGLAAGVGIAVAIALFGRVSGAHCNPAVSLAAFFQGSLSGYALLPYWIAQFAGAIIAVLVVSFLFPEDPRLAAVLPAVNLWFVALLEGGFVLFLSLLQLVATARWRMVAPLLVGMLICAATILLLPVSGAALNPARIVSSMAIAAFPEAAAAVWVLVLSTFLGGAVAGLLLARSR